MQIEIYGKPNCPYCTSAKSLLEIKKLDYKYIEFFELEDKEQEKVRERAPSASTFPIIFLEETYIGGFTQLQSVFN